MKMLTSLFVIALALACSVTATAPTSGPVYVFGSAKSTIAQHKVEQNALPEANVAKFISEHFESAPRTVLTFSQSGLSSVDGNRLLGRYGNGEATLGNVQAALKSSEFSLTLPYTYLSSADALRAMSGRAQSSVRSFSGSSSCSEFTQYVEDARAAAGEASVHMHMAAQDADALARFDACLPEVTLALGANHVIAVAGINTPVDVTNFLEFSASRVPKKLTAVVGVTMTTGQTMFALALSIFLLIAVYIGVNCTLNISTPHRYAQPYQRLPQTKEY